MTEPTKTVTMTIFNDLGQPENSFRAVIASEDKETITIKFPLSFGRHCLNIHYKKSGLLVNGLYGHLPSYVMMDARNPVKNSFAHKQLVGRN